MIYFLNMNIGVQRTLSNILIFGRKTLPTKYLGVPLTEKASKYKTWEGILTKMQERVKIWTYRTLNLFGHLILKKEILHVIPMYLMLVFPSPKGILQKIRKIQRNFLWRGEKDKKK
jgi:hypothetical protein